MDIQRKEVARHHEKNGGRKEAVKLNPSEPAAHPYRIQIQNAKFSVPNRFNSTRTGGLRRGVDVAGDTGPIVAETVLTFGYALVNGRNMPSAAAPAALSAGGALHFVEHRVEFEFQPEEGTRFGCECAISTPGRDESSLVLFIKPQKISRSSGEQRFLPPFIRQRSQCRKV
ncbi:hypothetical protein SLEP1_g30186 [Rubroshorea leprosula]|uniref:Uncharacterized protein n=1 Tax=Rubroshorea leprosula TaxID=152421 RepID=A0AAV5JZA9_9ROSI|nr:hypothetical protein SLEP1_g30186 [Rubroshorea leprosula]